MNSIREIQQINDQELRLGIAGTRASWHTQYAQSPWVYIGNLDSTLTEGDVLAVLSQWGELDDLHLLRDVTTGESRGFAFAKYADARSCILCVDNFCGIPLCGRSLRVDHVEQYRLPQHILKQLQQQQQQQGDGGVDINVVTGGHAYQGQELANEYSLQHGQDLFAPSSKQTKNATTTNIHETTEQASSNKQQRKEERQRQRLEKEQRKAAREEKRKRHRATKDEDDDDQRSLSYDTSSEEEDSRRVGRQYRQHRHGTREKDKSQKEKLNRTKKSKRRTEGEDGHKHDREDSSSPPQDHSHRRHGKKHKRYKQERSTRRHDSVDS